MSSEEIINEQEENGAELESSSHSSLCPAFFTFLFGWLLDLLGFNYTQSLFDQRKQEEDKKTVLNEQRKRDQIKLQKEKIKENLLKRVDTKISYYEKKKKEYKQRSSMKIVEEFKNINNAIRSKQEQEIKMNALKIHEIKLPEDPNEEDQSSIRMSPKQDNGDKALDDGPKTPSVVSSYDNEIREETNEAVKEPIKIYDKKEDKQRAYTHRQMRNDQIQSSLQQFQDRLTRPRSQTEIKFMDIKDQCKQLLQQQINQKIQREIQNKFMKSNKQASGSPLKSPIRQTPNKNNDNDGSEKEEMKESNGGPLLDDQNLEVYIEKLKRSHSQKVDLRKKITMKDTEEQSGSGQVSETNKDTQDYLPMQGNQLKKVNIDKQVILKMGFSLENLMRCLPDVFQSLQQVKGKSVVITIGNTGSGKSTMLNSLILGSKSLQEVIQEERIHGSRDIRQKSIKRKFIDVKQEMQEKCQFFKIGHSNALSETFLPEFIQGAFQDSQNIDPNVIWADIAGLQDTNGDLIAFISSFVNKKLFQIAKEVKFLIPFTYEQVFTNRGLQVRHQIQVIQNICQACDLNDVVQSIQPVLTKVPLLASQDSGDSKYDLEVIIDRMKEQFKQELKEFQIRNLIGGSQSAASKFQDIQQFAKLQEFFKQFAEKLVVFDPLDREISETRDGAPKSVELLHIIQKMPYISGQKLEAPLSRDMIAKLDFKIGEKFSTCLQTVQEQITEAKKQGKVFNFDIQNDKCFKDLHDILAYFEKYQLLATVPTYQKRLTDLRASSHTLIQEFKTYNELNQFARAILDANQSMFTHRQRGDFAKLVQEMIASYDMVQQKQQKMGQVSVQQKAGMQEKITKQLRNIEKIIMNISKEPADLFQFAYQLRKIDVAEKYSYTFLNGQVQPDILYQIFLSNTWIKSKQQLVPIGRNKFYLIRDDGKLLSKESNTNKDLIELAQTTENSENKQIKIVKLVLNPNGVRIQSTDGKYLEIEQRSNKSKEQFHSVVWKPLGNLKQDDDASWLLTPLNRDEMDHSFLIERAATDGSTDCKQRLSTSMAQSGRQHVQVQKMPNPISTIGKQNDDDLAMSSWRIIKA